MPTNDKEYMREYMKFYRAMMKEAKQLRQQRKEKYGEFELDSECMSFRTEVVDWLEGRIQKTLKMACEWDNHMCKCDNCAEWYVQSKRSTFKKGVNLFPKKE